MKKKTPPPMELPLSKKDSSDLNFKWILSMDPSGDFEEGNGTTGWALFRYPNLKIIEVGDIKAKDHNSALEYYTKHNNIITLINPDYLVLEDFRLYGHKAQAQTNSRLETVQLLGIIKYLSLEKGRPVVLQGAGQVKKRWENRILEAKGFIEKDGRLWRASNGQKVNDHILDSIRHGVHFCHFGKELR